MLQIQNICKTYRTGELVQRALDHVSLNLRDNEFVAILGPSGSGKTTLLNVIGGLDRYDDGDLIINGISTKKYRDRDWDSYRNHTVGFIFQSYNLIPHQSVLSNVELALTISGISRSERKERAKRALEEVGLGDQLHKRPSQMSGGQMQRVAIARALVNDPDILLADEPTGALDTETSVQVMELLKQVARDRLVVMVTHNPELAEKYATRIVRLRDGRIIGDTLPYEVEEGLLAPPVHKSMGKASMSFATALSLSFNNLRTKKARTILTAFAGSIGIIGIALILSLSNGVNTYITELQKSTMTSYPITISAQALDLSSLLTGGSSSSGKGSGSGSSHRETQEEDVVYSDSSTLRRASTLTSSITTNNLTAFKSYLDDETSEIWNYIGENGVVYSYDVSFEVYTYDPEGTLVNTDGSSIGTSSSSATALSSMLTVSTSTTSNLEELMPGTEGELISTTVTQSYELLYGSWPQSYDEVVLVVDENNRISATTLYQLGYLPIAEYEEILERIADGEEVSLSSQSLSYEELCEKVFYVILSCDWYVEQENGLFVQLEAEELASLLETALQLKVVGIIRPIEDADNASLSAAIAYTSALTQYMIEYTENSSVVTAQMENPEVNVLSGIAFSVEGDEEKIESAREWLSLQDESTKAALLQTILSASSAMSSMTQLFAAMSEAELAAMLDQYTESEEMGTALLLAIYEACIGDNNGSYEDNLETFGYVSLDTPSSISIYADTFEAKEYIVDCIDAYNETAQEEDQITYTDYVGLLMSSVTTIINTISYVLIAFVAVSLVVSSIMIGIITYISVLERTKEIGILRAIGASKGNIAQVFNAETFLIGLCSGLIGIGLTLLLLIPGNMLIHALADSSEVNAALPVTGAVLLILLSMVLTVIGGLIPSGKAARKDPVAALRSE